ncbi:tripartite tricarboxylate transporter substrate binding protein [Pseudorhodoferax sp. LjRoot39]|uniref:Bug family tripartite tricarboxylate transporter substrate binding protein n=1 Tax=Pseudorhodoferax sp. LjRoot39 TaxID=3342328 RepID=UPI003ECE1044
MQLSFPRSMAWCELALACLSVGAAQAQAQQWPAKPIQLVVGYAAGGALDVMARVVAQRMSESLGQPVVVDNRGGANAGIAGEFVARATPDGYTLLVATPSIESVNPFIYSKLPFDAQHDLAAVGALGSVKLILATRKGLGLNDTAALVDYAKAHPGKLTYGSAGAGSTTHLVGELFKISTGTSITHVPYRGASATLQDLLAEQIDFLFDPGLGAQHARAGKIKLLAVASKTRSPLFPDVPTLSEQGFKNMDWDTWVGVYAPAKTPAHIVATLNQEINKALATASVQQRLRDIGGEAAPMSPAEFKAIGRRETESFGPLIKSQGIRVD